MDYAALINEQSNRISQAQTAYNQYSSQAKSAQGNLTSFQKQMKTGTQFHTKYQNELGISRAESAVDSQKESMNLTQGIMSSLPNSLSGRTQSSFVTENQRQRQIQQEMQPLTRNLQQQSEQYGMMSNNLGDLRSEAAKRTGFDYKTQMDRESQLNQIWKQLNSQASTQYKNLQKAESQKAHYVQLKDRSDRFAQQLAEQRRQFEASLASISRQYASSPSYKPAVPKNVMDFFQKAATDPIGAVAGTGVVQRTFKGLAKALGF